MERFFLKYFYNWTLLAITSVLLFMSLNYHSKTKPFTYQSQIWADKAGYNIYLPLVLLYNGNANLLPDSIVAKTGNGFSIDKNRVITKYSCGVAMLQAPFFTMAHLVTKFAGGTCNGFSTYYQKTIDFAGVFYCVLGLVLLFKTGVFHFQKSIFFLATFAMLFGTNLLYYSIDETGMSHVYSFFLFSAFLYILEKSMYLKNNSVKWNFLFGLVFALILLIRPINGLIILAYFFWNLSKENPLKDRALRLAKPKTLLILLFALVVVWMPQLLYWKFTFGQWITYSYGKETFDFFHPKLWIVWFSAKQGAFLYGSLLLLPFVWMLFRSVQLHKNNLFYLFLFFAISYLTSCWHDPAFGCSFGMRNLVEYQAILIFPLAELFSNYSQKLKQVKIILAFLVLSLVTYNVLLVYGYSGCNNIGDHLSYWEIIEKLDL